MQRVTFKTASGQQQQITVLGIRGGYGIAARHRVRNGLVYKGKKRVGTVIGTREI